MQISLFAALMTMGLVHIGLSFWIESDSLHSLMIGTAFCYFAFWMLSAMLLSVNNVFGKKGYSSLPLSRLVTACLVLYFIFGLVCVALAITMYANDDNGIIVTFASANLFFGLFQSLAALFGYRSTKKRIKEAMEKSARGAARSRDEAMNA